MCIRDRAYTGQVQTDSVRNLSFEQGHQHTLQTRLFSYLQAICYAVLNRKPVSYTHLDANNTDNDANNKPRKQCHPVWILIINKHSS